MATPLWKAVSAPLDERTSPGLVADLNEATSLNLPANSGSAEQQAVLDALPVLVFLEREGNVVFANAQARQTLGIGEGEWVERPIEDVLWGLSAGTAEPRTHLVGTETGSPFHATLRTRNGRILSVEGTYSILNADLREAIIVAHPSGREKAPKSRLMEDVLASIPEAVVIVHGSHVLYTNPAFSRMFGYTADEAGGNDLRELIVPDTRQHELGLIEKEVDLKGRVEMETVRANKKGELLDVAMVAAPLRVDGRSVGYVWSFRDISERKQSESKVQMDALFDVPTGLANKALFLDRLTLALSRRSRRRDQNCGILLLDLDRFKEINEALGEAAGDALLVAVANRLKASLRPEDSAARLGGDEFGVLIENVADQIDLESVAARLIDHMRVPFQLFGGSVRVTASVGVVLAGAGHRTADLLLRDADFAMTRAKLDGGGCSEVFDKDLELPKKKSLMDPERELRQVLDRRQYEVWYQPVYKLRSGELDGFESLLRLRRADGSVDTFKRLLSAAESTGLSITLGRQTMDTVCRQLRQWTTGGSNRDLTLALNLTERQFYHPDMIEQLERALAMNQVDPARLLFEISESTLNENQDAAGDILAHMAECGVRLAVDNFGARFAPLSHLAHLPINVVKFAPKLSSWATSTGREAAVLESLVHLGNALGMQVVAQGVETPEQMEALAEMGCELGQGHLFAYAMDPARATILAGARRWAQATGA